MSSDARWKIFCAIDTWATTLWSSALLRFLTRTLSPHPSIYEHSEAMHIGVFWGRGYGVRCDDFGSGFWCRLWARVLGRSQVAPPATTFGDPSFSNNFRITNLVLGVLLCPLAHTCTSSIVPHTHVSVQSRTYAEDCRDFAYSGTARRGTSRHKWVGLTLALPFQSLSFLLVEIVPSIGCEEPSCQQSRRLSWILHCIAIFQFSGPAVHLRTIYEVEFTDFLGILRLFRNIFLERIEIDAEPLAPVRLNFCAICQKDVSRRELLQRRLCFSVQL
jgi:hypothetical protein